MSQPDPTPVADLVPGVTSRIVTVDATELTEGYPLGPEHWFNFALSDSLDDTSGGKIIAETSRKLHLVNGKTEIRLPTYDADAKTPDGTRDWTIIVTSSFGYCKKIRIPAGTGSVSLAMLPNVEPLTGLELQYAILNARVVIVEGSVWDASVELDGGILTITFTVPPGATAYWRGSILPGGDLDTATDPGAYYVWSNVANLPAGAAGGGVVYVSETRSTSGTVSQIQQEFKVFGNEPKTFTRYRGSTGWSAWQWAGGSDSMRSLTLLPADDLNNAVEPGAYPFWGGAANNPSGASGTVIVTALETSTGAVSSIYQLVHITSTGTPEIWSRFRGSTGWSAWTRLDAGAVDPAPVGMRAAPSAGMKAAPMCLSTGAGGQFHEGGSGTTTIIQHMPPTVERTQLHLRNHNPRFNLQDYAAVNVSAVAIGLHNGSGGVSGSWVSFPLTSGTTEFTSGWVDVPEAWRDREVVVRYTWSGTGTIHRNIGTAWTGGSRDGRPPLWAWLELLVPASTPVVGGYGDSLTAGVGAARPVIDSWLGQWAQEHGAVPAHWAHSGDASTTWPDDADRKWFLYGLEMPSPDAMIYAMGSNEVFGGASPTLAVMKQRVIDTVGLIRKKITPTVYGALIMPRTSETDETLRRGVNAWYPHSGLFSRIFDFGAAISNDDDNILSQYDSDGIHLNAAGYAQLAGTVSSDIVTWESARLTVLESTVTQNAPFQGILTEADADRVADLPFGWYSIGSSAAATALGMPVAYGGHLFTAPQGTATGVRFFYPWSQPSVGYQSTRPWNGAWSAWGKTQDASILGALEGTVTPIVAGNEHNIDDFVTPGMKWYVRYDATADPVRGYPAGAFAGYGEVLDRGGPQNLLQVYYSRASAPAWRARYNSSWGPWNSFAGGPLPVSGIELTPAYDSGVRNVAQAFLGAFTSSTSNTTLVRTGNNVEFMLYVRQFDKAGASAGTVLFTLPVGFRPRASYRVQSVAPSFQINVFTNGQVTVAFGEVTVGQYVTFNLSHLTADAPPAASSLPGTN